MNSEQTVTLKKIITKSGNNVELLGCAGVKNCPLIIGVFHGDEPQGKYLIDEYLKLFSPSPLPSPQKGEGEYSHNHNYTTFTKLKSKELRQNSTDAERKLWNLLRRNQLHELHFKRQKPIGKYIADFVCSSEKIIIEIDSGQHNEDKNIENDNIRTEYFSNLGYRVIRFWNNEVLENIDGVIAKIECSLAPLGRGIGRGATSNKLFIPCLNPDGMAKGTRVNANNVDLNRNFPTKNWGEDTSLAGKFKTSPSPQPSPQRGEGGNPYFGGKSAGSEIETKFLIEIIEEYKPSVILTLHAPYKVVNYDGPARDIAEKISNIIKYPVEESIGYPTPGSFGTWAGVERNIPVITLELDEEIPVEQLARPVFEIFDTI